MWLWQWERKVAETSTPLGQHACPFRLWSLSLWLVPQRQRQGRVIQRPGRGTECCEVHSKVVQQQQKRCVSCLVNKNNMTVNTMQEQDKGVKKLQLHICRSMPWIQFYLMLLIPDLAYLTRNSYVALVATTYLAVICFVFIRLKQVKERQNKSFELL